MSVGFSIRRDQESKPSLFVAPANPDFIQLWRKYEDRYEQKVVDAATPDLRQFFEDLPEVSGSSSAEKAWRLADDYASSEFESLKTALDFAAGQADPSRDFGDDSEAYVGEIERGLSCWSRLSSQVGLDLQGIIRRRNLVPFVLVPRQVANRESSPEKSRFYKNLDEAQRAFTLGLFDAAWGLIRSLIELVLRDHWEIGEDEDGLKVRLDKARSLVCNVGVSTSHLDRVKRRADSILHGNDPSRFDGKPEQDWQVEMEMVKTLEAIRLLIENAPI